ncbi:MAG: hypothetical protein NTZ57_07810 [Deltaproteobacteria bacterium]|jgi:hypothetical protein|nr:hypothetical protein [Deltaproteobacteria bacterium]
MLREDVAEVSCVGCGYCCIRNTCTFGVAKHPHDRERICPELEWTGARYTCKLMAPTNKLADFYRTELQAGGGCRSFNNPWRNDIRERAEDEAVPVRGDTPWPPSPDRS